LNDNVIWVTPWAVTGVPEKAAPSPVGTNDGLILPTVTVKVFST
jgi:hypothetical protein